MTNPPLPIDAVLPQLCEALRQAPCAVVQAPTGAGKTTRVPPALLKADLTKNGRIIMLEPRRLAVRAAAQRIANERGSRVGEEVGYQVRFDRQWCERTRILVVTPGILLRLLHDDPFLEGTDLIIFDEFHERGLESDLALGMMRWAQQTVRPDLRVVVMSATLEAGLASRYLGNCAVVISEGRLHPVEVLHQPRPDERALSQAVAHAVEQMLDRTSGDVLVFLAGMNEIRQSARQLEPLARARCLALLPLHGELPFEQQEAALSPGDRRKVILATNVAETSITVPGVTAVVDTGLARMRFFDSRRGLDRLQLTPIARASAEQRTGRAGRTQPGLCVRLWSAEEHRLRPAHTEPEIRRVDLASAVLQLLCWGATPDQLSASGGRGADSGPEQIRAGEGFPWLEAPRAASVTQALALLRLLEAVNEHGTITGLGRTMARLPVHPRLARMLAEGRRVGHARRIAMAAAVLAERDPFTREFDSSARASTRPLTPSDVLSRVEALEEFETSSLADSSLGKLNRNAARFLLRARDQFVRSLDLGEVSIAGASISPANEADAALLRSLLTAFPDRVARRREPGSSCAVMVGGRGVRLTDRSGVHDAEFFVCVEIDDDETEALVHQASAIDRDWLPADRVRSSIEVTFDAAREQVVVRRFVRYEDLVIAEASAPLPDSGEVASVLAMAATGRMERMLPADEAAAGKYLTRIRCLREWMPELQLPAFEEKELQSVLPMVARGCRSFEEVRNGNWIAALQTRLTPAQLAAIEREAPERIVAPSGSRLALRYEVGRPPVLAARIQELFGMSETPRVAAGRVRVLLHLLAPSGRPQQVTDDLTGFWSRDYPRVRQELRRRYPKHSWPEDPLRATPERQPRRK